MDRRSSTDDARDLPEAWRGALATLLQEWLRGESAVADLWAPLARSASTPDLRLAFGSMLHDELRHAVVVQRLVDQLGAHECAGDSTPIDDDAGHPLGEPVVDEVDGMVLAFLLDRAAGHRLAALRASPWQPLARAVRSVEPDELSHVVFGTHHVRRLASDRSTRAGVQVAFDRRFGQVLDGFGIDDDPIVQAWRTTGLQRGTTDVIREGFVSEVRGLVRDWGLRVPGWTPPWQGQTGRVAAATARHRRLIGA